MSEDSSLSRGPSPDRAFTRAASVVLAAWLALAAGATLALDLVNKRVARVSQLAATAAGEAAAIRGAADMLYEIARMPPGPDLRAAHLTLGWHLDRLIAIDARREFLSDGEARELTGLAAAVDEARREAGLGLDPQEAQALGDLFAADLVPQAKLLALQLENRRDEVQRWSRRAVGGSFALHLLALGALALGVVRPARARIAAWVRRSHEAVAEHRFRLLHDPLTQMPNGAFLRAHLEQLVGAAERASGQVAVLRVSLDRFLALRETLGAEAADDILRIAGRRIRDDLRPSDFAAHLGQDDFVLVTGELQDAGDVAAIAQRVQQALSKPFSVRGGMLRISCSMGVTLLSDDLPSPDRVLGNVAIALSEAQSGGPGGLRYFRESLRQEAELRERMFADLVAGLERDEFVPFFQPQIDLATGAFSGFEALVRWRHPSRGLLAPGAFLDFAERAELTERIGEAVLAHTLAAVSAWDAAGLQVPKVGINFAMAQLRDPRLIEKIKWEVERADVDPARLSIEVLETVLIKSDADLVVRNIRGLASAGFQIDLDDFGTGHASIQNLRRFMVNRIKIDRSFVLGIESSEEQQKLTASMIAMANALGIATLAEGVETAEAQATLNRLGCGHGQGYHIARPMPQADTFGWLRAFEARLRAAEPGGCAGGLPAPEARPQGAADGANMP